MLKMSTMRLLTGQSKKKGFGSPDSKGHPRRGSTMSPKGGDQVAEAEDYFDFAVMDDSDDALRYAGSESRKVLQSKYAPEFNAGGPTRPLPMVSGRRKYQILGIDGLFMGDSSGRVWFSLNTSKASSFPTVAIPGAAVTSGRYYYELQVFSGRDRYLQVGWVNNAFTTKRNNGVGDDPNSWAWDGQRRKKWNGGDDGSFGSEWENGDIISCAVDYDKRTMTFGLNRNFDAPMGVAFKNLDLQGMPIYPAFSVSVMRGKFHCRFHVHRVQMKYMNARAMAGYRPIGELLTSQAVAEELRLDMVEAVNGANLPVHDAMRMQMAFVSDLYSQRDRLDEFVEAEMSDKFAKKQEEHTNQFHRLVGDARSSSATVQLMIDEDEMRTLSSHDAAAAVKSLAVRDDLARASAEAGLDLTRDSACIDLDRALKLLTRVESARFSNIPFCREEDDDVGGEAKPVRATALVLSTILKFVTGRLPPAEELLRILPVARAAGPALAAVVASSGDRGDEETTRRPWLLEQVLPVLQAAQRWSVGVGLHPLQSLQGMSNRTMEKYFGVKGASVRLLSRAVWGANPAFVLPEVDRVLIGFFSLMQGDVATGLCRILGIPRVMLTQNTVQLTLLHNESIRNSLIRVLLRRLPKPVAEAIVQRVRDVSQGGHELPPGLTSFEEVKLLQSVSLSSIESAMGLLGPVDKVQAVLQRDTSGKAARSRKGQVSQAAQASMAVVKFAASQVSNGIATSVAAPLAALSASASAAAGQAQDAASSMVGGANLSSLLSADIMGARDSALGAVGSAAGAISGGISQAQGALSSLGMVTDFLSQGSGDEIFAKRLRDPKFLAVTLGGILLRGNPGELLTTIPVFVQALVQNEPKLVAALGVIQHFIALMQARLRALEDVSNAAASQAESVIGSAASVASQAQTAGQSGAAAAAAVSAAGSTSGSSAKKALAVSKAVAEELGKRQEHIMQLLESVVPVEQHGALAIVDAILSLSRRDISGARKLALQFGGFNKDRLETIINTITGLVEQLQRAGVDTSSPGAAASAATAAATAAAKVALDAAKDKAKAAMDNVVAGAKTKLANKFASLPLVNGRLSDQAIDLLYDAFDTDGGGISFDEFVDFTANASLPLTNERAKRIFASLDVIESDNVLDRQEFKAGIHILLREITEAALSAMGLSWDVLLYSLMVLVVLLVIMLVFILLGVQAMSGGSTFGAVVNSAMPLAGGLGLAAGTGPSQVAKQLREKATALKQRIADAIKNLQPKD